MSTALVPYSTEVDKEALNQAMMTGDLGQLTPEARQNYYLALCLSSGLNPLTRPFIVITAESGEKVWYATKECAEQLRKLHHVSMRVLSREHTDDGMYIVTVEARLPSGRVEEAQGIVPMTKQKGTWETSQAGKRYFKEARSTDGTPLTQPLFGKERADAYHRAESKAKRRATLALCGLGLPEVDNPQVVRFDPNTGLLEGEEAKPDRVARALATHAGEVVDTETGEIIEQAMVPGALDPHAAIGELFDRSEGRPEEASA
jgi:hypothetical protein